MRFAAILNADGGTLRTLDLDAFTSTLAGIIEKEGHEVEVEVVPGDSIQRVLKSVANRRDIDVVIAGGGDGTISTAAGVLMGNDKALAVLPAGTMNLFARSLGVPLKLEDAVQAFASGKIRKVDIATADNRPFVHQFSIGLHAKMVHLRDKMEFGSKLGKIGASAKAVYWTIMNPPSLKVRLKLGGTELFARTAGIGVTNNMFGEGHLPYADHPDGGVLGVYVTMARRRRDIVRFGLNMARGKWKDNDQVEIHETDSVEISLLSSARKFRCVIDGELYPIAKTTKIRIHPGALNVLVPRIEVPAKAA